MPDRPRIFRGPRGSWIALALIALVTVVCAVFAFGLEPSTGINTLVSSSSADYKATQLSAEQFGSSAVVVLVKAPLSKLLTESQLTRVSELEACLDGQQLKMDTTLGSLQPVAATTAKPYAGPASACGTLMRERPTKVVYGPGTFLNHAVAAVNQQIAALEQSASSTVKRAEADARRIAAARGEDAAMQAAAAKVAGELALEQELKSVGGLASQIEATGDSPSIANSSFLNEVVFGSTASTGAPSSRFSYLFPSADAALIQVRLKAGLSASQQAAAIKLVRAAVQLPQFHLSGGSYTVTGEPVVLADVASGISGQLLLLLVGAVVVMGLVLLLIFRRRLRLLPLLIALCAAAVTFGLSAIVGASLTIASIAVLPILIGLAVDYAVQLQSGTSRNSVVIAGVATAAGFLALLLSPVPMVRGFGLLLVLGVIVALVIARVVVTAVPQTLMRARGGSAGPGARAVVPPALGQAFWGAAQIIGKAVRGAGELIRGAWWGAVEIIAGAWRRLRGAEAGVRPTDGTRLTAMVALLTRRPLVILAVGLVLAAGGWFLDAKTSVQSDITKLVPAGTPALRHLSELERITGTSGEIDVLVHARTVATPRVIDWMVSYQQRMTSHFGYSSSRGCAQAMLCPALSLPALLGTGSSAKGSSLSATSIDSLLDSVPSYFKQAVITRDGRYATLAFGIRLMPLAEQSRLIEYMRSHLNPPAGVSAQLSGLPVLGADADASLSSSGRRIVTVVVGLLLVALALLAVFRNAKRALVPLVPIVLATGWSALIVYLLGIPLNPLSATLGALVIAISTEFSVLLSERVRSAGGSLHEALASAYRSTGLAIITSGITVIVGFGVLILSNINMLSDFGLVTLVDLTVSLVGVLAVLPAVLALSGHKQPGPRQ
jgi:uncharacterized protein